MAIALRTARSSSLVTFRERMRIHLPEAPEPVSRDGVALGQWLRSRFAAAHRSEGQASALRPGADPDGWLRNGKIHVEDTRAPAIAPGALAKLVTELEREIASLDASNTKKLSEIDGLVTQISSRERELRRERDDQRTFAIFGAMVGAPAAGMLGLVQALETDGQLKTLRQRLEAAKTEQVQLHAQLGDYLAFKKQVEGSLAKLERAEKPPRIPRGTPRDVRRLLEKANAVTVAQKRVAALTAERKLLLPLRDEAAALGARLDTTLKRLDGQLKDAERAVDDARSRTRELLETLGADDPQAAALKKLDGLARRELGRKLKPVVDDLLSGVDEPKLKTVLARQLTSALTRSLMGAR